MKVLFAVSNESISNSIVKKYQKEYKEIISYKNVYYFNAILKELQKDKTYDRVVIGEELEQFTNSDYEQMDKFIFEKLDGISDEATNGSGNDIPILLICSERRSPGEQILVKLFGIGIYNAIMGKDRSIDEVCRLINRPRTKKEAKIYYKIESEDVNYQAENENDVSEVEVQNILAHYKRLGKNEERYIESFNNIASQYNDVQLRLISKYLPLYVRAVLEEKSPKYQQIMSFNNSVSDIVRMSSKSEKNNGEKSGTSEKLLGDSSKNKLSGNVIIPQNIKKTGERKLTRVEKINFNTDNKVQPEEKSVSNIIPEQTEEVNVEVKRKRGRPRKEDTEEKTQDIRENLEQEVVRKKRGRPRKNPIQEEDTNINTQLPGVDNEEKDTILPGFGEEDDTVLPGFGEENDTVLPRYEEENDTVLPGFGEEDDTTLPGFEEENDTVLPGFEEDDDTVLPGFGQKEDSQNINTSYFNDNIKNTYSGNTFSKNNENVNNSIDIEDLLSDGKKVIAFVGTSKNGTSFIVNSVAEKLSSMGIDTAIFDATQNKNSYYIYTKNDETLRKKAIECIANLKNGIANGIRVNKNLTVYTSIPNDENSSLVPEISILETLVKYHSVVLIDCDFNTPLGYFKNIQELYLVQSMDILTIQPLTAFLDELKAKNALDITKIRIILNKYVKLKGVNEKTIIGGMAYYNDPEMSIMEELFDRNVVKFITIPFEIDTYIKYLEGIIDCDVSIKGYSKQFKQVLDGLCNMIYPTVRGKEKYVPNQLSYGNGFSSSMNNTLNRMKQQKY